MPACSRLRWMTGILLLLCGASDSGAQDSPQAPLKFKARVLTSDLTHASGIAAADLDNDGDVDLSYSDSHGNNDVNWFENTDGTYEGLVLHPLLEDKPKELYRHTFADLTKDGRLDLVIGECGSGDVMWLHNFDSKRVTAPWRQKFVAKKGLRNTYDYAIADFDGDQDPDVAALSYLNGNVVWFANDGNPANDTAWEAQVIGTGLGQLLTFRAADFDGDKDPDLLATEFDKGRVLWFENTRRPNLKKWPVHVIDEEAWNAAHGNPCDMDADGDTDILMAMGFSSKTDPRTVHQIVWYKNTGDVQDDNPWPRHRITVLLQAYEAVPADLDSDGDLDIVGTGWGKPGRVIWCENPGDPLGEWTKHILKEGWENANQVIVADFNGDQRPDIAAIADEGTNELMWWINEGAP